MIPKNIVQIYVGPESDELDYFLHLSKAWETSYPDWNHHVFRDNEVEEHIRAFSADAWSVYNMIDIMTYRADLARLIILHNIGGVYIDLDTRPNLDLNTYVVRSPNMRWGFCFTNGELKNDKHSGYRCHNHLIASEAKSTMLKNIIDGMLNLAKKEFDELEKSDVEMQQGMWISSIVSVEGTADRIVSILESEDYLNKSLQEWLIEKDWPMTGWSWIWQDEDDVKINKEREFVTHIGSLLLKDMPDTTPPNQNIMQALANLYKDISLKSGNIKLVSKGVQDGV